jgi:hypothetical protein
MCHRFQENEGAYKIPRVRLPGAFVAILAACSLYWR